MRLKRSCSLENVRPSSEACAALKALEILDSDEGRALLEKLRAMTAQFESGLVDLGFEVIPGEHPVVSGGVPVTGWKRLESAPAELPASAVGKVWVADMPTGMGRFYTLYDSRGRLRPMYEKVLNHYENRKGLKAEFTRQAAMKLREGSDARRSQGRRSRRRRSSALDTLMFADQVNTIQPSKNQ